jgi:hypothetical protein
VTGDYFELNFFSVGRQFEASAASDRSLNHSSIAIVASHVALLDTINPDDDPVSDPVLAVHETIFTNGVTAWRLICAVHFDMLHCVAKPPSLRDWLVEGEVRTAKLARIDARLCRFIAAPLNGEVAEVYHRSTKMKS